MAHGHTAAMDALIVIEVAALEAAYNADAEIRYNAIKQSAQHLAQAFDAEVAVRGATLIQDDWDSNISHIASARFALETKIYSSIRARLRNKLKKNAVGVNMRVFPITRRIHGEYIMRKAEAWSIDERNNSEMRVKSRLQAAKLSVDATWVEIHAVLP